MARLLHTRFSYLLFVMIFCTYAMLNMILIFVTYETEPSKVELRSYSLLGNPIVQKPYYSTEIRVLPPVSASLSTSRMKNNIVKQKIPMKTVVKTKSGPVQHTPQKIRTPGHTNIIKQKPISDQDFVQFLDLGKPGGSLINTQNFTFSLNSYACQKYAPFLLTFVHSAVTNDAQRQVIRNTWGGIKRYNSLAMATVFLVGSGKSGDQQVALEMEAAQHGDLVQGPFLDTYRNLSFKHVMGLAWAWRYCPQATYVVKVDDDTLVNPYRLLAFLKDIGVQDRTIYCRLHSGVAHRHKNKWQVSLKEYPFPIYPNYCEGFAYVLRRKTCKLLTDAAVTSKFFWIDDVYVTGLLRTKAGVQINNFRSPFGFAPLSKNVAEDGNKAKTFVFFRGETRMSEMYLQIWKHINDSFRPRGS